MWLLMLIVLVLVGLPGFLVTLGVVGLLKLRVLWTGAGCSVLSLAPCSLSSALILLLQAVVAESKCG